MDFQLTDEQKLISETAREFADKEIAPRVKENDRAARFDRELASKLGEVGYLGAPVAEEYGGRGLDYLGYGLIVEQVGRADSSARTVVSVQTSLVAGSIERWGTEEQKQTWLPKLCSGESLGCFGLTEPDTGSDAANLRTRATKTDSGWSISGQKMWISPRQLLRGGADLRPDRPGEEAQGPRLLPGPDRQRGLHHPGDPRQARAALLRHRARSRSTAVEVGEDAMLGEIGDGFKVAMSALDNGRYSVAAGCVGICEGCVEASVAYAKEREQFGVPLARFQLVQEMIADMILKRDATPDAGLPRRRAQGRKEAEHDRDLGGEALRDRVGGRMREPGDPGPRRRRLRRRLPGRALPARRPGDDPLRGHLADPEADHRPRRDRDQRDDADVDDGRQLVETSIDEFHVALLRLNRPEARNALSPEMMDEIAGELERSTPTPRCAAS